ncbi:MAG: PilZ domain-containing protein [Phycisphaerae bacterium]|nr:PilZ domain-containing protein [Phycisphaerae bacterium]
MDDSAFVEKRRSPRVESASPVEFVLDSNTFAGVMTDVSSTGVRMTTPAPMEVNLVTGSDEARRATLVWACRRDDGSCMYGFKYVDA